MHIFEREVNGHRYRIAAQSVWDAQQGRSVYEFLSAAVEHWFHDEPGPSLLES